MVKQNGQTIWPITAHEKRKGALNFSRRFPLTRLSTNCGATRPPVLYVRMILFLALHHVVVGWTFDRLQVKESVPLTLFDCVSPFTIPTDSVVVVRLNRRSD